MFDDMIRRYGPVQADGMLATVTLYGGNDVIDHELCDELGRRGCRTHNVTVQTGWLSTATHAAIRIETPAGAAAIQTLRGADSPRAHIVAICEQPTDQREAERVRDLCRSCSDHHELSLIWHPPLVQDATASRPGTDLSARALAAAVADELSSQAARQGEPSFSTRSFASA